MTLDYERFRLWYVEPLRELEKLPDSNGGFIALATSCFLYERYAKALLNAQEKKADRSAIIDLLASDFDVNRGTAEAFWNTIRDGLLHEGMPMYSKQGKHLSRWAFRHDYPAMCLDIIEGESWLKVQPWKFMNKVISLWESNFTLIAQSDSFPWADIRPVPV